MNLTTTRTHDSQYRLTNLTLAGPGGTLDQLADTLDPAGNVDYLDDQLNSAYDRDYSYDVLNRLKWDSGVSAGNPTYTYDDNGNRLTRTAGTGFPAQTISYVAGKNRMGTYNSTAVSYDGMGNVTNSGNNLTATTEVNDRLLTATVPNSRRVTLLYNGLGEMARARTETRSGNQWTTQYWEYASFAPDGRALGLIQENTSRTEWEWVWLDNLPVVQFQDSYNSSGTYTGTTVTYLHPDHLGTPRIGTSTAGAISWRYRSDAFGIATISGTHTVRLRLPGQIDLGTGGINYNYFRDYDPNVGRYLESDPIGLDGGLNPYTYVESNPLAWNDPEGLSPPGFSYNAQPPRTVPVKPGTERQVLCMANCIGVPLVITGGAETWTHERPPRGKHHTGDAVDFGTGANPQLDPRVLSKSVVNTCACECGFTHGGWEPDFIHGSAPHYHFQNGAGNPRVPALQCNSCRDWNP